MGDKQYRNVRFPVFRMRAKGDMVRKGFPPYQGPADAQTRFKTDNPASLLFTKASLASDSKQGEFFEMYGEGKLIEKLDELREEFAMPDKIAFKYQDRALHRPAPYSLIDFFYGHTDHDHLIKLPSFLTSSYDWKDFYALQGISIIFVTIENEKSVWYDSYVWRCKQQNFENINGLPKDFPDTECTLHIDKFLDMNENEYEKLCNYIDEPPLDEDEWKSWIRIFRKHIGVDK